MFLKSPQPIVFRVALPELPASATLVKPSSASWSAGQWPPASLPSFNASIQSPSLGFDISPARGATSLLSASSPVTPSRESMVLGPWARRCLLSAACAVGALTALSSFEVQAQEQLVGLQASTLNDSKTDSTPWILFGALLLGVGMSAPWVRQRFKQLEAARDQAEAQRGQLQATVRRWEQHAALHSLVSHQQRLGREAPELAEKIETLRRNIYELLPQVSRYLYMQMIDADLRSKHEPEGGPSVVAQTEQLVADLAQLREQISKRDALQAQWSELSQKPENQELAKQMDTLERDLLQLRAEIQQREALRESIGKLIRENPQLAEDLQTLEADRAVFLTQHQKLMAEKDTAQAAYDNAAAALEKVSTDLGALRDSAENLRGNEQRQQAILNGLAKEEAELTLQIAGAEEKITQCEQEIANLKPEDQRQRKQLRKLLQVKTQLSASLGRVKAALVQTDKIVLMRREQLESAVNALRQHMTAFEWLSREGQKYRENLATLGPQVTALMQELAELQAEHDTLEALDSDLSRQKEKCQREISLLEDLLEVKQDLVEGLGIHLNLLKNKLVAQEELWQALQRDTQAANERQDQLLAQKVTQEKHLLWAESSEQQVDNELTALNASIAKQKERVAALEHDRDESQAALVDLHNQAESLKAVLYEVELAMNTLPAVMDNLRARLKEHEWSLQALQLIEESRDRRFQEHPPEQVKADIAQAQRDLAGVQTLVSQYEELKERVQTVGQQNAQLSASIQGLNKSLQAAQQRQEALLARKGNLEAQLAPLAAAAEDVQRLTARMAELQAAQQRLGPDPVRILRIKDELRENGHPDLLPHLLQAHGQTLAGRYQIDSLWGVGKQGLIFRALDSASDQYVIIKQPFIDYERGLSASPFRKEDLIKSAKAEARALRVPTNDVYPEYHQLLEAPSLISTRDQDLRAWENIPYLVEEYIPGVNLADAIDDAWPQLSMPEREHHAVQLLQQYVKFWKHLYDKDWHYSDISAKNLIYCFETQKLRVLDPGCAVKLQTIDKEKRGQVTAWTPEYMTPGLSKRLQENQGRGKIDITMVYPPLARLLHHALSGQSPEHDILPDLEHETLQEMSPRMKALLSAMFALDSKLSSVEAVPTLNDIDVRLAEAVSRSPNLSILEPEILF